ncbi:hypothetical protein DWB58_14135 [candidate division KSB1 bacterium]|nr:hypothetical protein [candidate division KSB1 bacterium]
MNLTLKKNVYAGLRRLGVYRFLRWWHRKQAVILTYHGVISNGDDSYLNRNSLSAEMFDQQMAYLKRHYHIMSLPELVRRLVAREPLPPYALVITFDDGFYNNYAVAAPILRKYDLPATIFLTTAFINSPQLGLWTERVDWLLQTATTAGLAFAIASLPRIWCAVISSGFPPKRVKRPLQNWRKRSALCEILMAGWQNDMLF